MIVKVYSNLVDSKEPMLMYISEETPRVGDELDFEDLDMMVVTRVIRKVRAYEGSQTRYELRNETIVYVAAP